MPPVRAGRERGEAPGRPLSPASRGARKAGRSPSGAESAQRGSAREQNALPSLASSSRSVFLSRVSARVPTGTGTARCESPGLSRGSCGRAGVCVPGAGRGALGRGVPALSLPFVLLLSVCPHRGRGARNRRYLFRAASCYGCAFARGREHAWDSRRDVWATGGGPGGAGPP